MDITFASLGRSRNGDKSNNINVPAENVGSSRSIPKRDVDSLLQNVVGNGGYRGKREQRRSVDQTGWKWVNNDIVEPARASPSVVKREVGALLEKIGKNEVETLEHVRHNPKREATGWKVRRGGGGRGRGRGGFGAGLSGNIEMPNELDGPSHSIVKKEAHILLDGNKQMSDHVRVARSSSESEPEESSESDKNSDESNERKKRQADSSDSTSHESDESIEDSDESNQRKKRQINSDSASQESDENSDESNEREKRELDISLDKILSNHDGPNKRRDRTAVAATAVRVMRTLM